MPISCTSKFAQSEKFFIHRMSDRDSVSALFFTQKPLRVPSLWQRDRDDTEGSIAPKVIRDPYDRVNHRRIWISKALRGASVETWITAGGPLVQVGSAPVHLVPSKKLDRPLGATAAVMTYPRETLASLAVQRRVLARKRVLSLNEIWHPLRRFVEKRVRGGP